MLLLYQHQPFPPNLAGAAFVRPFTRSVSEMWEMEALPSSALWDLPLWVLPSPTSQVGEGAQESLLEA